MSVLDDLSNGASKLAGQFLGGTNAEPSAEATLRELVQGETSVYTATEELEAAVNDFVAEYSGNGAEDAIKLGKGLWEAFYAPHIVDATKALPLRVDPVRYRFNGNEISAFVQPRALPSDDGEALAGWFSASGTVAMSDPKTLTVNFDTFWVDGKETRREEFMSGELTPVDKLATLVQTTLQQVVPDVAEGGSFPVLAMSKDLAVFRFPATNSNIAIKRIGA